ncbi:MAG TPA: dockerin type I repeat-containing protein [Candidatus Acutalibacter ornithocaccae]|uniref:Dockerin type I repeat-containing protein n=1 Tax=Candidatus Acutalibacter ornithocaccae TaxID=2838416 RepID=A0A9D2LZV0_9FIRM|nr:dockerin type I repeat-containing protein [Candidatus Acutalibacter ornithocaccae]
MRKHPRPFRKLRGLRPLATFCALGALVFLLAFLGETQPAARQVASIPPGGEVRLFEEQGSLCLLAYSGQAPGTSALYALDTATGEALSNYVSFQGTLVWARQRGSSLFAVEHSAAGYTLHQFALPNFGLEPIHSRLLSGVSEDTFSVFDCDGEGRFFYANGLLMTGSVQDSSLSVVQAGGSMVSGVSFLEVTPQGTLVAAAAGQLYVGSAASPGQWEAIPAGDIAPLCLVGENYLAATDGRLYRLGGGSLSPVGSAPLASGQLCAVDQEGRLVYGSGGRVQWASLSGEVLAQAQPRGELLAVCGSGALTAEEGFFWFTPLSFQQAAATPTPSPTAEPTPTPTPEPTPTPAPSEEPTPEPTPSQEPTPSPPPTPEGIVQEGGLLVMPQGVTVKELLAYFAPEAVHIRRPDGTDVTSGNLATGMTAGEYTIAVLGDCDGSGTLSQADLRQAQALLLEDSSTQGASRRAGDLDGDGLLTTQDLVLLSQRLEP